MLRCESFFASVTDAAVNRLPLSLLPGKYRSPVGVEVRVESLDLLTPYPAGRCSFNTANRYVGIVELCESICRAILGNCRIYLPTWLADFHRKHEPDGLSLRSLQQLSKLES